MYTLSGALLGSKTSAGSVGAHVTSTLSFSASMDMDNNSKGLYLSGVVDAICAPVTDNYGNFIYSDIMSPDASETIIYGGAAYPKY